MPPTINSRQTTDCLIAAESGEMPRPCAVSARALCPQNVEPELVQDVQMVDKYPVLGQKIAFAAVDIDDAHLERTV